MIPDSCSPLDNPMDLKTFRKKWSAEQKALRGLLAAGNDLSAARELFLTQHRVLHSAAVSGSDAWSYADQIFSDLPKGGFREIPRGEQHSLIWILWHISRIEDIAMRILVAGGDQEYLSGGWVDKLASPFHHTGNLAPAGDMNSLTEAVDPALLLEYRNAVGKNTRELVLKLEWEDLRRKVVPERLNRLAQEGAVLPEAEDLLAYWGKRVIYELLLMPSTRHLMVHLNEAWSIRNKLSQAKGSQ